MNKILPDSIVGAKIQVKMKKHGNNTSVISYN